MADFAEEITAGGAGGWLNALTLAQASGYTGGARTTNLTIEERYGALLRVKFGVSSAPAIGAGIPLSTIGLTEYGIDLGVTWIYFPLATDKVSLSFHSDIDF
jgi:hypothetical protein